MATAQSVLERAKQGEPKAIATLMNQTLKVKGMHVQIKQREGEYKLLVEAAQLPNKAATVQWIASGLKKLSIPEVETVTIYGKCKDSDKPDWMHCLQFADAKQPNSVDPFAEAIPQKPASSPAPSEPPLDLREYCFTRNKSLLSGSLTLPSKEVVEAVLLFVALSNAQKLVLLPHVDGLLRKPEEVKDEALSAESKSWISNVIRLESNDLRKLSIWLSRYCANPIETVEQLSPKLAVEEPEPINDSVAGNSSHSTENLSSQSTHSSKPVRSSVSATTQARSTVSSNLAPSASGEKVMFAKGSNTPVWVFPAVCSLFLAIAITLGISSVDEMAYAFPVCDGSTASKESCVLAVQLMGDEFSFATAVEKANPAVTEAMKATAAENCSGIAAYDYGQFSQGVDIREMDFEEGDDIWLDPNTTLVSSKTDIIFPGVLLTDVVHKSEHSESGSIRVACLDYVHAYTEIESFEYGVETGDVGVASLSTDEIPMNWPNEPYTAITETELSVAKSLGIYDVFISLGANTLFTAVGIFVAVIFSSCYRCYTYSGVYQMASVLGIVETAMHSIPGFGWFASLAMDVVAMGLASMFVKDFHIDWTGGYAPLARGVLMVTAVRTVLSLMLYGAIAQMVM